MMNKGEFLFLIKEIADNKLTQIQRDGFASPGHNGPYMDQDTPVRNSAHWLCTYCSLYCIFGEKTYYQCAQLLGEYILREEHYGVNGAVKFRGNNVSDSTNGVIGPAWVIEALVEAAKTLED